MRAQCHVILSRVSRWMDEDIPTNVVCYMTSSFTKQNINLKLCSTKPYLSIYVYVLTSYTSTVSFSLPSMASSIIPRHYCSNFATTPILFHSNNHSKSLNYPFLNTNVGGFSRSFTTRCSYQTPPTHHSQFDHKHVSFLKICSFLMYDVVSFVWRLCNWFWTFFFFFLLM